MSPEPTLNLAQRLASALSHYRFSFRNEAIFQDNFELMLKAEKIDYEREVFLSPKDRPDFMIAGAAVDLKIGGPINAHLRQLKRYANYPIVTEIILIATRQFPVPSTLSRKPCHCLLVRML